MATFEVVKRYMEAIVFTKTPWPILSNNKYSIVEEAWRLAIQAQDCQWALAGAPVGTPAVSQLPGGPLLKIELQTLEAVSLEVCLVLLYPTYGWCLPQKIYIVANQDLYHSRTVSRWGMFYCCR